MVAGHDLVDAAARTVVFKGDKVAQKIKEALMLEHTVDDGVKLENRSFLRFQLPPDLEPFVARGQRTDAGRDGIGDDEQLVVGKKLWKFFLVRLELLESALDGRVLRDGALELKNRERQPVDEHKDVGASPADRELIDDRPIVLLWALKVDKLREVPRDAPIGARIFDRYPVAQVRMKGTVGRDQGRGADAKDLSNRLVLGVRRHLRIQAPHRAAQAPFKHDVVEARALGARLVRRNRRSVDGRVAKLREPLEHHRLNVGFCRPHHCTPPLSITSHTRPSRDTIGKSITKHGDLRHQKHSHRDWRSQILARSRSAARTTTGARRHR